MGVPYRTLATCSQDKTVQLWKHTDSSWERLCELPAFEHAVWRLSWNVNGTILAVTTGDNKVTLMKEGPGGEWKPMSVMDTANAAAASA